MSVQRISAIIVQHFLRMRRSLEEVTDTFYWPVMDVIIWGFLTVYLSQIGGRTAAAAGFLLGGLILWSVIWRSQQDITVSMLWDVWNRNLLNLFTSPLSPWEFIIGTVILGALKIILTLSVMIGVAFFFYSFNLFRLGFGFLPYIFNLLFFGWTVGILMTGIILRFGRRIQNLAWSFLVLFNPVSAVYYPVASLPAGLQMVARLLPTSYVFEGMRLVLAGQSVPTSYLMMASILNLFYLLAVVWVFHLLFEKARELGKLAQLGE